MQPTITCKVCGQRMSIDEALLDQIKQDTVQNIQKQHEMDLSRKAQEVRIQVEAEAKAYVQEAEQRALKKSEERYLQSFQQLKTEAEEEKKEKKELRDQITELMRQNREATRVQETMELEMQKKLFEGEKKIREEAEQSAFEKQRLHIAEREKTISDLKKALEDAQRKANQGSQQLQGEILELDIETTFKNTFRDDFIEPVSKGTKGGDIYQTVQTVRGIPCGIIMWETKNTKNWSNEWVTKLKEDVRAAKANIPVIITEAMPKDVKDDIGFIDGVWICKPRLAIVLATLLRKSLLDAAREKSLAQDRGTKADALFNFVTSHEFVQQVEGMIETYLEMTQQITKERVAYEKIWAQREKQNQRIFLGTANIIGGIQGQVGQSAMPRIKGLELLEQGGEATSILE